MDEQEAMDIFERKCQHFYATEGTWMRTLPWHPKLLPVEQVYVDLNLEVVDRSGKNVLGKIESLQDAMGRITVLPPESFNQAVTSTQKRLLDKPPPRTILVTGPSGSGKSTLLLELAFQWAQRKSEKLRVFKGLVLYTLKDLKDEQDLTNAIDAKLAFFSPTDHRNVNFLKEVRKNVLVLLDGYDEASEEGKLQVRKFLQVDSPFFCSTIVVATRTTREDDFLKLFMIQVKLSNLQENSAKKIIEMATDGNSGQAEHIELFLKTRKIIAETFLKSPLLLYSLCYAFHIHEDTSKPMTNPRKLCFEIAYILLRRKAHNLTMDINETDIRFLVRKLREMFYKYSQQETTAIPLTEFSYFKERKEYQRLVMESGLVEHEGDSDLECVMVNSLFMSSLASK